MFHGIGAYAFIMGIISGYPVGAKIVTEFRKNGFCTKAQAERLLAFTNNSGPLFIIGTVGIAMFGNTLIGILLFVTHILSCIIVGFLFRFWKYNDNESIDYYKKTDTQKKIVTFSNLGEILSSSIMNAINTVVMIGGFVILFSVILSILNNSGFLIVASNIFYPLFNKLGINTDFINPILSGILELTNGLNMISQIPTKNLSLSIIFSAFILGFGGLSVGLQVLSIISKSDISIKPYIIGKFLQGIIAAFLTFIFINIFPIFNFDLVPIVSHNVNNINIISSYTKLYNLILFALICVFSVFLIRIYTRKRSKLF